MAEERIITINLRKRLIEKARWKRKRAAIKVLREMLERRLKKKVKIDKSINEKIHGSGKVYSRLRIKLEKMDDETFLAKLVS